MENSIDFLLKINDLQKTKRYGHYPDFWESVSEHVFKLVLIVDYFYHELNLKLDYQKCISLALYHDFGEMDLEMDIDAKEQTDIKINLKKEHQEMETISYLAQKYNFHIQKYYDEYNLGVTFEAKFVKACDKVEACLHVLSVDKPIMNPDFFAVYADQSILAFPPLLPIYSQIKKLMKEKYQKFNIPWHNEYENCLRRNIK